MTDATKQEFIMQRFYTKDISFEAPNSPKVFLTDWKPDLTFDLSVLSSHFGDDNYEVILQINVTVQSGDLVAFVVELQQAGLFTIAGFSEEELSHNLNCFCANNLYPYAREVITDLVMKGGFPQLLLPPVNFDSIYAAKLAKDGNVTSH